MSVAASLGIAALVLLAAGAGRSGGTGRSVAAIALPPPDTAGRVSLERTLRARRSRREYGRGALGLADVAQLLWAAQGITGRAGERTAPSAGALYPLEVYVAAGEVEGLAAGIYSYDPAGHRLVPGPAGDRRSRLGRATFGQSALMRAPAVIVIAAVYERVTRKYGTDGRRYVHMEAGSAVQNVYLEATARGLATVQVGAFDDAAVRSALELPADHRPLVLMPVGRQ